MIIPNRAKSWLLEPNAHFVCSLSAVVGLLCYALSPSFEDLFGKWSWWKLVGYIVFSCIICFAVWFSKAWTPSTTIQKALADFCLLIMGGLYYANVTTGKPDVYSVVSSAAFFVMSLDLTRLSRLPLCFFCGSLTLQLMKMDVWLVVLCWIFFYCLVEIHSTLEPQVLNQEMKIPQDLHPRSEKLVLQVQDIASGNAHPQANVT